MKSLNSNMTDYLSNQVKNFFPDGIDVSHPELLKIIERSLRELKECFSYLKDPYFIGEFDKIFNYLNGDHYSMFLYKVSNISFKETGNVNLAEKLFQLNRALHGLDAYYKIELPPVYVFTHPLGTILGGAKYGNFFSVSQSCTIGNKEAGHYPELGEGTIMFSNSSIIGRCKLGNNVIMGAGSRIIDREVKDDTLIVGEHPNISEKEAKAIHFDLLFDRS